MRRKRPDTALRRFAEKIAISPDGCWLWTGATAGGYGRIFAGGRNRLARCWAFEHFRGRVPRGRELDHLCRNTRCCNPWCLEAVSHRTNTLRGVGVGARNAKKERCPAGHRYDVVHVVNGRPRRRCRRCLRAYMRTYKRRTA